MWRLPGLVSSGVISKLQESRNYVKLLHISSGPLLQTKKIGVKFTLDDKHTVRKSSPSKHFKEREMEQL